MTSKSILPYRPNKLAYPGSTVKPGIDLTHPASNLLRMSAVFQNGNFIDLTNGKPATINGSPSSGLDGNIGPYGLTHPTSTDAYFFSGKPTVADTQCTMAVIVKTGTSVTTNQAFYFMNTTLGNNTLSLSRDNGGTNWRVTSGSSSVIVVTISTSNNGHPYFWAASVLTTGIVYMIVRDLMTGQIFTGSASSGVNAFVSNGTYQLGNYFSFSVPSTTPLATGMFSSQAISSGQLLKWADDPWSFWYPQQFDLAEMLYTVPGAIITGGSTLPVMGVG